MSIRTIKLPSGEAVPILGQGTWGVGENARRRDDEVAALRLGLDVGLRVIDTDETYADGNAEHIVGEAIAGHRDEAFIITKLLPGNANRRDTFSACERSLRRLGTDYIDLYLLHWRGRAQLEESVTALAELAADGKIRHWGVSNFGSADMAELDRIQGGDGASTNQVLYNLSRRGIEFDLLPWCLDKDLPLMAYAPFEQGRLLDHPVLIQVASALGATPAQVALAWVLHQPGVAAIARTASTAHVRQNVAAVEISLSDRYLAKLDLAFPPPTQPRPLEVL